MFELRFLGTAGYFPNQERHTLGVLLPRLGILFDAGSGLFRLRDYLATPTLDVFLSHAHLDHICGLPSLLGIAHARRLSQITVHAEPDKIAAVRTHLFAEKLFPVSPSYDWQTLEPGQSLPVAAEGTLRAFALSHPGNSIGFRIDWPGHSIAYVTDTTADPAADYVSEIAGVELLLHECNFNAAQADWARKTGHSWTSQVGRVAAEAQVGRLIVMHVDPLADSDPPIQLQEIRQFFSPVTLAEDLMVVEF